MTRKRCPTLPPVLLTCLILGLAAERAQAQEDRWGLGVGAGMAVDVVGTDQEVDAVGIAIQAVVTRRTAGGLGYGLLWDGAWFDGRFATEKRILLATVVTMDVPGSRLRVHAGPGLGLVTVVDADLPEPGTVGDAVISVGDEGAWGGVAGVSARFPVGSAAVAPMADLVWAHARGHDVVTLVLGGRLSLGR